MWIGYEDSLRRYICDLQLVVRTIPKKDGSMSESKIQVEDPGFDVRHPWWATRINSYCWISHRSALLTKELSRNEKKWYVDKPLFNCRNTKIWKAKTSRLENKKNVKGLGYVWYGKLSEDKIDSILKGEILPPETIAFPETESINRPGK